MYTQEDKIKIADLLRDCQQLVNPGRLKRIPGNYAQLKEAALLQELSLEVKKLTALFSPDATNEVLLQQSFLRLCAQREEQNQGTCMSYTASPEGICNGLYLEIAIILFKPRHFGELVAVLLPGMKASLTAELVFSQAYTSGAASLKAEEKLEVALKEEPFSAFAAYPAQRSMLTQVVTGDNVVFNLESIANIPLRLREQFHRLMVKYRALKNKIYKHNDDLQQLWFDLELINQHGATPDEMLRHLSNELLRAGTRFTGNVHAAGSVTGACSQFRHYLDQLPSGLEEKLVAMRSNNGADSLAKVLEHLADASCVEQAGGRITKIRENPANKELLNSHPGTTREQEYKIKQKYEKAINITGFENTNKLPEKLTRELIKNIRIKTAYDYIDLLLNLPQEEYLTFLTHASIACDPPLPAELASATNMLSTEQTTAFFEALFAQRDKFGGTKAIVFFAVVCNITAKVLQAVPENELHSLIGQTNGLHTSLLALAALHSNPEIWRILWGQLSAEERSLLLSQQNDCRCTPLHYAARNNNPEILRTILEFLPEQERLISLIKERGAAESPLYSAIKNSNPALLQTVRQCLSTKDYQQIITDKNVSLLDRVVESSNTENLTSLIAYLKQHKLRHVLCNKSNMNRNILHRAAPCGNPEIVRILLAELTEQEIDELLGEKDTDDSTPLHMATANNNFHSYCMMMEHLTVAERFADLSNTSQLKRLANARPEDWNKLWNLFEDKNKFASLFLTNEVSLCWSSHRAIWRDVWGALTVEQRSVFVKWNVNGQRLLQYLAASGDIQSWSDVWELYSQNERLVILSAKFADGDTILHRAAKNHNQEVTRAILQFLYTNDLLTALNIKGDKGTTPFDVAILNHNSSFLFALLELIPAKERLTVLKHKHGQAAQSALHLAANKPDCWRVLWQLLPAEDRPRALMEKNENGVVPLHLAIYGHISVVAMMLSPLSQQERMQVLSKTDSQNRTPIYMAVGCNTITWKSVWHYMPEQLRLSEIKEKRHDVSLLHFAASNNKPELVVEILKLLPEQDRFAALTETNTHGNTPLHMASTPDNGGLSSMLECLPQQNHLTAIRMKKKDGNSVFHLAAQFNADNFYDLLQALPEGDRLTVLEDKNNSGLNSLSAAIQAGKGNVPVLTKIQELLPLNQIIVLLKAKDKNSNNSLHFASEFPALFLRIMRMLPEEERLLIVNEKNISGDTPLHRVARSWDANNWPELWNLFTDKSKFASLFAEQKNDQEVCPLHVAAKNRDPLIWHDLWGALNWNQKTAFKTNADTSSLHVAAQASLAKCALFQTPPASTAVPGDARSPREDERQNALS